MQHMSYSENDTGEIARDLAKQIGPKSLIFLHGNLGSGKSVFARALIRALCGDPGLEVPSPTFTLVQSYDGTQGPVFHYDFYRLEDPEEIYELGWEENLSEGICIVEWPERLGPLMPRKRLDIRLYPVENKPDSRRILIEQSE